MPSRAIIVAVLGAGECDDAAASVAFEVGRQIALRKCILVTGGRGGVMEAASRGASSAGGLVIGVLPGTSPDQANEFVDIPIVTGLREARNVIIARTAQGLIAMPGEAGTLSEIAFALKFDRPIVAVNAWKNIDPRIQQATAPAEAVELILKLIAAR